MVKKPVCNCPNMTELFTLLGKKWSLFILHAIGNGSHTFTEIRSSIGDANTKILTDRLAELVEEGILEKSQQSHYLLSPLGRELDKKIRKLGKWWGEQK
jgi:DNA-binding HxlR family transcriptional regulator